MRIDDMDEATYHARPEVSSTQARLLLDSPARYKHALTATRDHSATFDLGSAVHAQVLGVGWDVVELPFDDWRSKAAREARDEVRASGGIPMLAKDLVQAHAMTAAVLAHSTARDVFEQATGREVSIFGEVDGVPMRCRFDALSNDDTTAVDLKTTLDASPAGFRKSIAQYGYHVQAAWYEDTLEASDGERPSMTFVTVEKTAPYLVAVYTLDPVWRDMGRTAAAEARRLYTECTETGTWPGYPEGIQMLEPPPWQVIEHEDRYDNPEVSI